MANKLIRRYGQGHLHFITFTCFRRLPLLRSIRSRRLRRKRPRPGRQLSLAFESGDDSLRHFWQRRFYDFNVWSLKKKIEKQLDYMHLNPLQRKLVHHPKDGPWSSFSFYSNRKHGRIGIDSDP